MRYTLGDTTDTTSTDTGAGGGPSLLQQLIQGFTTYKIGQQQLSTAQSITNLNIQRVQAGLPPINPTDIAAVPGINVGLASGTQSLLLMGFLLVGGLVAVNMFTKRK